MVIVPVGVSKKDNGSYSSTSSISNAPKVMFSDGIACGSDLANIDQRNEQPKQRRQNSSNRNAPNNKFSKPRSEYITNNTSMAEAATVNAPSTSAASVVRYFLV